MHRLETVMTTQPPGEFEAHYGTHTVAEESDRFVEQRRHCSTGCLHQISEPTERGFGDPVRASGKLGAAHLDLTRERRVPSTTEGSGPTRVGKAKEPNERCGVGPR